MAPLSPFMHQERLFGEVETADWNRGNDLSSTIGHEVGSKKGGLTMKSLASFRYNILEHIFYGIPNLKVPTEMSRVLTPYELLAKYVAAGHLKRYDNHRNIKTKGFFDLISLMDEDTKRIVGGNFSRHFAPFTDDQQRRLSILDETIKQSFVDSFNAPYIPSTREEPSNPISFYDPNSDGSSSLVYARRIYDVLKKK